MKHWNKMLLASALALTLTIPAAANICSEISAPDQSADHSRLLAAGHRQRSAERAEERANFEEPRSEGAENVRPNDGERREAERNLRGGAPSSHVHELPTARRSRGRK